MLKHADARLRRVTACQPTALTLPSPKGEGTICAEGGSPIFAGDQR